MGKIVLYGNGNSQNHGCEALTRTICHLFAEKEVVEFVNDITTDPIYGIDHILKRKELENNLSHLSRPLQFLYKIAYKLKWHHLYNRFRYAPLLKTLNVNDIALSIGGDNYCYTDISWLQSLNYLINRFAKTVLFGVSIEPKRIKSTALQKDLRRYSKIVARESLTYDALIDNGLGDRAVLLPDPAFLLEPEVTELPKNFIPGNTVGINISPMIMDYEKTQNVAYQNYENLVQYILDSTDMSIALIPHVVWQNSDDRIPLQKLYETFQTNNRVCIIEDQSCTRLKYIISQCRFFVGARTHATIAAYSSCVPTLVVGYSIKAKGIAKDLFGTYENYVFPVQSLTRRDNLTDAFSWLISKEQKIRTHLITMMPEYIATAKGLLSVIEENM